MKIQPVLNNFKTNTVKVLNEVGCATANAAKDVRNFAVDKFIKDGKKLEASIKQTKPGKQTALGAAVLLAGAVLAAKCIQGIHGAVKNVKDED